MEGVVESIAARRRRRAVVALATFIAVVAAAGLVAAGTIGGDDDRSAGPDARDRTSDGGPPPVRPAEAVGRLEIPAIDLDVYFVEGTSDRDLEVGPGHYVSTAWPGKPGNSAIAGHRVAHGGPFNRLVDLTLGDEITITTEGRVFTYEVQETLVVKATADEVILPTFWSDRWARDASSTLTLTTTHATNPSSERLIVGAELVDQRAA